MRTQKRGYKITNCLPGLTGHTKKINQDWYFSESFGYLTKIQAQKKYRKLLIDDPKRANEFLRELPPSWQSGTRRITGRTNLATRRKDGHRPWMQGITNTISVFYKDIQNLEAYFKVCDKPLTVTQAAKRLHRSPNKITKMIEILAPLHQLNYKKRVGITGVNTNTEKHILKQANRIKIIANTLDKSSLQEEEKDTESDKSARPGSSSQDDGQRQKFKDHNQSYTTHGYSFKASALEYSSRITALDFKDPEFLFYSNYPLFDRIVKSCYSNDKYPGQAMLSRIRTIFINQIKLLGNKFSATFELALGLFKDWGRKVYKRFFSDRLASLPVHSLPGAKGAFWEFVRKLKLVAKMGWARTSASHGPDSWPAGRGAVSGKNKIEILKSFKSRVYAGYQEGDSDRVGKLRFQVFDYRYLDRSYQILLYVCPTSWRYVGGSDDVKRKKGGLRPLIEDIAFAIPYGIFEGDVAYCNALHARLPSAWKFWKGDSECYETPSHITAGLCQEDMPDVRDYFDACAKSWLTYKKADIQEVLCLPDFMREIKTASSPGKALSRVMRLISAFRNNAVRSQVDAWRSLDRPGEKFIYLKEAICEIWRSRKTAVA